MRIARTAILAYGPLFTGPTVEHGPYVIHTVRQSVTLAYGPSFTIDSRYVEVQIANTSMFMPGY